MIYRCGQGCEEDFGWKRPPSTCEPHGTRWSYAKPLGSAKPRKPLKQGKGFSTSKAQREKVKLLPCAYCGREASEYVAIDPAHVWPRGKGGCDHEDCVIPACREPNGDGCHRLFDEGKLELLPALIDRGYWAEMAHPIACHQVSPYTLVERLTTQPANLGEAA